MPHGYREGRITPRLAGFVLAVAMTAGCGRLPVQPFGPSSFADASEPETTVISGPPDDTPERPVEVEVSPGLPDAGEPLVELPGTTSAAPLLESALARASGLHGPPSPPTAEQESEATARPISERTSEPASVADGVDEAGPTTDAPAPSLPEPEEAAVDDPQEAPAKPFADVASPSDSVDPAKPIDKPSTRDEWRDGIEGLRAIVRGHAGEPHGVWTLRTLLLDALAKAGEGGEDANLWSAVLPALGVTDEPQAPGDRPRVEELHAAILALEDQAPLEITDLQLCRKVSGFGNFDPLDSASLKAGQAVIIYCELSGLRSEATGDGYRTRLASHYEIRPKTGGDPVIERSSLGAAEDLCRRRRRDYYANYRIDLPRRLPPGSYELRLTQEDEIAGRSTSSAIPLSILP